MLIFGGFYDITKELNDMYLFDFENEEWVQLFQDDAGVKKTIGSPKSPYKSGTRLTETRGQNTYMDLRTSQKDSVRVQATSMSQGQNKQLSGV